jgi:CheY-like chemotaxis protein
MEAGMDEFITKPVDPPILHDVILRQFKHNSI